MRLSVRLSTVTRSSLVADELVSSPGMRAQRISSFCVYCVNTFHAAASMMALPCDIRPQAGPLMAYSFGFSVDPWVASRSTPSGVDSMFQVPHGLPPSGRRPVGPIPHTQDLTVWGAYLMAPGYPRPGSRVMPLRRDHIAAGSDAAEHRPDKRRMSSAPILACGPTNHRPEHERWSDCG